MSDFTVRIELHGAAREEYDTLHNRMEAAGYRRFMRGISSNGAAGIWVLPTAEYDYTSSSNAYAVRDHAKGIADTVRTGSWCLVTEVADRAISSRQV